ncbi:flagellar protein FliT [Vibrio rotiferianus]|uniref:Flagellar protein FliT n=1 Tax=Vibrio rotiferianus TaxID=190895 RepID=A0A510I707_9VIBR|nr:flagellar protein FliT [Vibrio rotiferianus]BBL89515.1 flagellar protein FliT [Vibrio rotiferianus]
MESELASLRELDQLISQELEKVELNTEEILRLVDIREQMLQNLLPIVEGNTDLKQDAEWQAVVTRTKEIVELMQCETGQLGKQLHKLRYGQRSLQQYKKFT